jgi:hypothetical protein
VFLPLLSLGQVRCICTLLNAHSLPSCFRHDALLQVSKQSDSKPSRDRDRDGNTFHPYPFAHASFVSVKLYAIQSKPATLRLPCVEQCFKYSGFHLRHSLDK